jgi:hypothetical protein
MELTYEESGLVYSDKYNLDEASTIFTNKMIALFKKDDTFFKKTSLKRAHTLAFLSNAIEQVIFNIQMRLIDDDILFSVEHYANYYSTLAYILSLNTSFLKWEDFMLAFLFKCDDRGVTHRDVATKTYVTRYAKNLRLLGDKRMDKEMVMFMLFCCEADLTGKEHVSDSLGALFEKMSTGILNIKC